MSTQKAVEYAALNAQIKRYEERVKQLKARKDALEEPLREYFSDAGIQNLKLKDIPAPPLADDIPHELADTVLWIAETHGADKAISWLDSLGEHLTQRQDKATVYLSPSILATVEDRERAARALSEYPHTSIFVRPDFHTNTLSAYLRELPRDPIGTPIIPDELKRAGIGAYEKVSVRVRRG